MAKRRLFDKEKMTKLTSSNIESKERKDELKLSKEKKRFSVQFDEDTYNRLNVYCSLNQISKNRKIEELVVLFLDSEYKGKDFVENYLKSMH